MKNSEDKSQYRLDYFKMEKLKNQINNVFLSIGTNLGDRFANINQALKLIENEIGQIIKTSSNYKTEPLNFTSANYFINNTIQVRTSLSAQEILDKTQTIEKRIGRTDKTVAGVHTDRVIDIDILYINDDIIQTKSLTIPHSKISERKFVLVPLAEISPDFIDPITQITISKMLINCADVSNIIQIKTDKINIE